MMSRHAQSVIYDPVVAHDEVDHCTAEELEGSPSLRAKQDIQKRNKQLTPHPIILPLPPPTPPHRLPKPLQPPLIPPRLEPRPVMRSRPLREVEGGERVRREGEGRVRAGGLKLGWCGRVSVSGGMLNCGVRVGGGR